ncbi:hypothetical protein C900_02067 [Fulvivirga imtechensis AK7]|uniref:Uncharacterized protein n=1 Tax=Fulvivirga imtechensis AK7 TaxID=1237149 RepID=L8JZT8_9BACT|nr:hypothetical protein [Fulvivirga imtechensis]ELR73663.1 hypothetical protein C900_02067 [Fulvivirga imtechensis AK7]
MMEWLIVFVGLVLLFQIAVFFMIRAKRKKDKRENVIEKYNIRTPADAFRLLQDHSLPDNDRKKIERLYRGE